MTITSSQNQRLKEIRKLRQRRRWRERSGRFVAEGEDLLAAADSAGWVAVERFCAAGSGLPGVEVDPKLLAQASGLASSTRALGVYQERWSEGASGPLCVYLHGLHDPGNLGTLVRAAQAFGVSSVALGPGSADPFGPKAVRASMGAIFSVALARVATPDQLPGAKVALTPRAGLPLADVALPEELTLMIGAEREGLPDELVRAADLVAHIPIGGDSLNAAMAATIALYETTRGDPTPRMRRS